MHDIAPALVSVALIFGCVLPIIVRMVFRHQVEMAEIAARSNTAPQVLGEVQELKKQISDLRELVMDIALQPSAHAAMQQRVNQDK